MSLGVCVVMRWVCTWEWEGHDGPWRRPISGDRADSKRHKIRRHLKGKPAQGRGADDFPDRGTPAQVYLVVLHLATERLWRRSLGIVMQQFG